jgi:hypothetical protein
MLPRRFVFEGINPFHLERLMNRSPAFVFALAGMSACALAPAQTASPQTASPAWRTAAPAWAAAPASAVNPPGLTQRQPMAARPAANRPGSGSMSIPLPAGQPLAGAALQSANRALLIEARTPDRRVPSAPSAKLRDLAGSGAIDGGLAPGVCVRVALIASHRGQFTPGGLIAVRGCRLGHRRGTMHLLGNFPGGRVELDVVEWTDQMVAAEIPGSLKGVVDQEVRLQLVLADGQRSNEKPAQFLARRETLELPAYMVSNVNCAHPQPSRCETTSPLGADEIFGLHHGDDSQGGRDEWRLVLGSRWAVERIDYLARVGEVQASVRPWLQGAQLLSVDWRSQRAGRSITTSEYHAMYKLRLLVTGPAGVPLTADLP